MMCDYNVSFVDFATISSPNDGFSSLGLSKIYQIRRAGCFTIWGYGKPCDSTLNTWAINHKLWYATLRKNDWLVVDLPI
jgi:hypothetical protein